MARRRVPNRVNDLNVPAYYPTASGDTFNAPIHSSIVGGRGNINSINFNYYTAGRLRVGMFPP